MSSAGLYEVLRRPLITEKANDLKENLNQYSFEVAQGANKHDVKRAIEKAFGVKVSSVRTQIVRGKWRRMGRTMGKKPNWKKAVVTLQEGHEIDFFGEV